MTIASNQKCHPQKHCICYIAKGMTFLFIFGDMKIKNSFYLVAIVSFILLASCGGNSKKEEVISSDSLNTTTTKIPEELKAINEQLDANPNSADLYHQRAKYYYKNKDFKAGLEDMMKVIQIDSSKADYFLTLSDFYFVINKTGNAKAALEKCIKLDEKNVDAMLKLAELYLYVRKNEKSIEYINMALKVDKYNSKAYFMKGMNYKDIKDTARAISSMQTAVEQDQQYYNAYMQLGLLTAAQKNPLAIQYYKNAIRIQPKSIETWYALGKFYQDMEDWNNAIASYTTLLQFENNKFTHYNMGVIYLEKIKKPDIAINHFSEAIKLDPNYIESYFGRGLTYQSMHNIKLASEDYQACLSLDPNYEPALDALQKLKKN